MEIKSPRKDGKKRCPSLKMIILLSITGVMLAISVFREKIMLARGGADLLTTATTESSNFVDHKVFAPASVIKRRFQPLADPPSNSTQDPPAQQAWKKELYEKLDNVRQVCGDLCAMETASDVQKYIESKEMLHWDCPALIDMQDASSNAFPGAPPPALEPFYSLHGAIPIQRARRIQRLQYLAGKTRVWTKDEIETGIQQARNGTLKGSYSHAMSKQVGDALAAANVQGKSVLVIGSEKPWIEVILLSLGASKVTTLEYAEITSQHPQIETYTPDQFRASYKIKPLLFDGVVTFSSLEHSGLGRYGDALNPWGDLIAMARAWCVTKPNGFMVVDVPGFNRDFIKWNFHRVYGSIRFPLLTANWKLLTAPPPSKVNMHFTSRLERMSVP